MKLNFLTSTTILIFLFFTANSKIKHNSGKTTPKQQAHSKQSQYKIPRENLVFDKASSADSPSGSDQRELTSESLSTNNTGIGVGTQSPVDLEKLRQYTHELLSNLEKKGQKLANQRKKRARRAKTERKKKRKRKLSLSRRKRRQRGRKALFGPSAEETQKLSLKEQEHMFKLMARKVEWKDMMSAHRSAHQMKMMVQVIEEYGENFYSKMDHLEMNIMNLLGKEKNEEDELEHEEKEEELEHEKEALDEEAEHEHEEMLSEKSEMLRQEQEKLEMEERMEQDIEALNHQDAIEDPEAAVTKDQLNLVQQQLVTLQQQLAGLQSSVEENEDNRVSLQEKIKSLLPSEMQAGDSNHLVGDVQEFKEKEKAYGETKTALEAKITVVQQQVNTMQHQLNLMHQKQNKLDLENDVESLVNKDE